MESPTMMNEPVTAMDSVTALEPDGKKKKKGKGKKKKVKMTKAEKLLVKLEKGADVYMKSGDNYMYFLDRMNQWILKFSHLAMELFKQFDMDGDGYLSYDDFKSCMFDLNAPCNAVELHLLAKVFDKDNGGDIEYEIFQEGLGFAKIALAAEDQNLSDDDEKIRWPSLTVGETPKDLAHCPCCKVGLHTFAKPKYPKYIQLMLRLVTFDNKPHHGHFTKLVHSHIRVFNVIELIKEETGIQTTKMAIFGDKSREGSAMLAPDDTLEECGMTGGPYECPQDVLLYYDYTTEFNDCPILMCDHYFGQKKF